MKIARRFLSFFLALLIVLTMSVTVCAADSSRDKLVMQMLTYYVYHGTKAETDIARLCAQIGEYDPALGQTWQDVMDYWAWADHEMTVTPDILPNGLPEDDSLCIVVLGYALNPTGSMTNELIGRLEVALASAIKYPNAYILCTGGGTASRNSKKTEAGQMASWLKKHGIDENRIIIEDDSLSTIQNAQYSCKILANSYPQVRHIALVSSDYHVPWGCVYFQTQLAFMAYEAGTEPLTIVGNAGYPVSRNYTEDLSFLYTGIAQIAGIDYKSQPKPTLSKLTNLEVDGAFTYAVNTDIILSVTAVYNNGFTRDVTSKAIYSGVDMTQINEQLLTVTYKENGVEITKQMLVDIIPSNGYADWLDPTASESSQSLEAMPLNSGSQDITVGNPAPMWPFLLLAALLALLALLLRLKIHINK